MVKTDAIVEGVHFLPDDPPDTVARKALRVNLSDLAAKGAVPCGFVLTLALRKADDAWLAPFARGLGEDAAQYGCPLLGGDTVSTPGPLMISIAAFGRVPPGKMVHRIGAQPGDRVVVTGTIGDAALGLDILKGGAAAAALADDAAAREMLIGRYRVPQPRNALAQVIREYASASMDVSDGLAGDLAKLCAASGVSAVDRCTGHSVVRAGGSLARARNRRHRSPRFRRRRLRDLVRDTRESLRGLRARLPARRGGGDLDRNGYRGQRPRRGFWMRRAGKYRCRACPTAISRIFGKARVSAKYLPKSTVLALRGVAPGI